MRGIVEVKRWVNLTGVAVIDDQLGVVIAPGHCIVDNTEQLSDRAMRKKLKSGIGTLVDLNVAIGYSGPSPIWYPTAPVRHSDNMVKCTLCCHTGPLFHSWKYVGEIPFAKKLALDMVPTIGEGYRMVLRAMDSYYPGEFTAAGYQALTVLAAKIAPSNDLAEAILNPVAMAKLCQELYDKYRKSNIVGRGNSAF